MKNALLFTATLFLLISGLAVAQDLEKIEIEKEIHLKPGEDYVIEYKSGNFVLPEEKVIPLPEVAHNAINKVPAWLQKDFTKAMEELYLVKFDTGENASLLFHDVNNDNQKDIIVGTNDGAIKAYAAPLWKEIEMTFKHIKLKGVVRPAFSDINGDGKADLVIGTQGGQLICFAGPDFKKQLGNLQALPKIPNVVPVFVDLDGDKIRELILADAIGNKSIFRMNKQGQWDQSEMKFSFSSTRFNCVEYEGKETLVGINPDGRVIISSAPDWKEKVFNDDQLPVGIYPTLEDVNYDGLIDIVLAKPSGGLVYLRNRGTTSKPYFIKMQKDNIVKFPMDAGTMSSPAFADINGDGKQDLVVGCQSGEIWVYLAPDWKKVEKPLFKFAKGVSVCSGNLNDKNILVFATEDGKIKMTTDKAYTKLSDVVLDTGYEYAVPCLADYDLDGKTDLVVGTPNSIFVYKSENGKTFPSKKFLEIPAVTKDDKDKKGILNKYSYFAPQVMDINSDGTPELIVGTKSGYIRFFDTKTYEQVKGVAEPLSAREFCIPTLVDLNGDNKLDIVAGNVHGNFKYFENIGDGKNHKWLEKHSWIIEGFAEKRVTDIYSKRYYSVADELLGINDTKAIDFFAKLIINADKKYVDEIAFTLAHTPSEIVRTAFRLGCGDLYLENAKAIYEMADIVSYAKIVDKEDHSTIEYTDKKGKYELSKDKYYWWVVHPRLQNELPLKVNCTWWYKSAEERKMDQKDWLRYKDHDIYAQNENTHFWRTHFLHDKTHGDSLSNYLKSAKTVDDALFAVHDFVGRYSPHGFMDFGYLTGDNQPMLIYYKQYGSCGEHSIILASIGRTALLPVSVVTDKGEDHQWNEYWYRDRWYHWDIGFTPSRGLSLPGQAVADAPWTTNKLLSTIVRNWGDDRLDWTTKTIDNTPAGRNVKSGRGYTDTAKVKCVVKDKNGKPVDGALVVVYSFYRSIRMKSCQTYTDEDGKCEFDLGYIDMKGGFQFVAITPFGVAGIDAVTIWPFKEYTFDLQVPGEMPMFTDVKLAKSKPGQDTEFNFESKSLKRKIGVPSYYLTRLKLSYGESFDETKFQGIRLVDYEYDGGKYDVFVFDKANYDLYKAGKTADALQMANDINEINYKSFVKGDAYIVLSNKNSIYNGNIINFKISKQAPAQKPSIEMVCPIAAKKEVGAGEPIILNGKVKDNLGVKEVLFSINGGKSFVDITDKVQADGTWKYNLTEYFNGTLWNGEYKLVSKAVDYGNNETMSKVFAIKVHPERVFKSQIVKQDNPENPLPKSSYIIGPFKLDKERFVSFSTKSDNEELDVDTYLYFDKNKNGILDGKGEQLTMAAGQSSNEHIFTTEIKPGIYWYYVQGWAVPGGMDVFDLDISFDIKNCLITEFGPTGFTNSNGNITAKLYSPGKIDFTKSKLLVNGKDVINNKDLKFEKNIMTLPVKSVQNLLKKKAEDNKIEILVYDYLGNVDKQEFVFKLDNNKPVVKKYEGFDGQLAGTNELIVNATDDNGIQEINFTYDKDKVVKFIKEKDTDDFKVHFNVATMKPGQHELPIIVIDKAGNEVKKVMKVKVAKNQPLVKIKTEYPVNNATLYLTRPVMQVFVEVEDTKNCDLKKYKVFFDGKNVTDSSDLMPKMMRYFPPKVLKEGEHEVVFEAVDKNGLKDRMKIYFNVVHKGRPSLIQD